MQIPTNRYVDTYFRFRKMIADSLLVWNSASVFLWELPPYFYVPVVNTTLCITGQLTLQSYTVHGESSGQLGGNLHAATNQGLPKHVLEGLVKVGAVAQLADHGDSILMGQKHIGMNTAANTTHQVCMFGVTGKIEGAHRGLMSHRDTYTKYVLTFITTVSFMLIDELVIPICCQGLNSLPTKY